MVQGVHHEAGAYSTYGRISTGEKNYDRKRKGGMIMMMICSGRYVDYNTNKNKNKYKSGNNQSTPEKCHLCNKEGHWELECPVLSEAMEYLK